MTTCCAPFAQLAAAQAPEVEIFGSMTPIGTDLDLPALDPTDVCHSIPRLGFVLLIYNSPSFAAMLPRRRRRQSSARSDFTLATLIRTVTPGRPVRIHSAPVGLSVRARESAGDRGHARLASRRPLLEAAECLDCAFLAFVQRALLRQSTAPLPSTETGIPVATG
ncbi:hypothetical protein FB451DRAFT_1472471 [Mycena latifolia]|nr:hypothetical protein FB451DRAFT_1472471 [Mycena latifolia]